MSLLILEALAALAVLVFIVWWTMFSGRRGGERIVEPPPAEPLAKPLADPQAEGDAPSKVPRPGEPPAS